MPHVRDVKRQATKATRNELHSECERRHFERLAGIQQTRGDSQ